MDARQMTFKDGVFDCVIDKGTLDSILVNKILSYNVNLTKVW